MGYIFRPAMPAKYVQKELQRVLWLTVPNFLISVNMSVWSNESRMSQISLNKVAHMSPNFPNWFQNITGSQLLTMTKDEILDLTGMKVGPSLKIENLTTQLRMKVNPAQERMKAGLKKLLWAGNRFSTTRSEQYDVA